MAPGSFGNYFDFHPKQGSFLANPPFAPEIVALMADHMHRSLSEADAVGCVLCFVVVIPHWPEKDCWKLLANSRWVRRILHVAQAEHCYMEGGQHYRPALYRLANHDSTMFILQSKLAVSRYTVTDDTERILRQAWHHKTKRQ